MASRGHVTCPGSRLSPLPVICERTKPAESLSTASARHTLTSVARSIGGALWAATVAPGAAAASGVAAAPLASHALYSCFEENGDSMNEHGAAGLARMHRGS